MFHDIEIQAPNGQIMKAKNTNELNESIAGFAESCIDPKISPELREEYGWVLSKASLSWVNRFEWDKKPYCPTIFLYKIELFSEEIIHAAGVEWGGYHIFMLPSGEEFVPAFRDWECKYKSFQQILNCCMKGTFPIKRILSTTKLGR